MNAGENAVETRGTPALGSCSGSLRSVRVHWCQRGPGGDPAGSVPGFPRVQGSRIAYLAKNKREKTTEHFGAGMNLGQDSKHPSLALSLYLVLSFV